jgi:hypothetical protein
MHSSTSGSDLKRAIYLLFAGCALVALGAEGAARVALDRVSRIQRRTADEYRLAQTIGHDDTCGRRHLLMVGNSMLLEDVDFGGVRQALAPEWDTRRFVIEQTNYYDWYYGLKRLFREGARPDVVVLMMTSRHWIRPDIRGDYTAQYLIAAPDLPAAARDLHLDATETASLVFARASKFWGTRTEIRNFLLGRIMPDLGNLMNFSSVVEASTLTADDVEPVARTRITAIEEVLRPYGTRLVVLLPALLGTKDGSGYIGVMRAARSVGVSAMMPVGHGVFGADMYRDGGFHLNAAGAAAFTKVLAPALRNELATLVARMPDTEGSPSVGLASRAAGQ